MARKSKKVAAKGAKKKARKASGAATKSRLVRPRAAKPATPRSTRISVDAHATAKLVQLAAACFGSGSAAAAWFEYPKQRLAGKSPRQACRTSNGREEVRAWLEEIADGAFA